MEGSAFFITAVFFLGASVGGLLVTLQRQCAMDRIRSEFNRELALAVESASNSARSVRRFVPARPPVTQAAQVDETFEDVADEEFGWEHLPFPPQGKNQTHAGI